MKICFISPFNPLEIKSEISNISEFRNHKWPASHPASDVVNEMHKRGHEIQIISFNKNISEPIYGTGFNLKIAIFPLRKTRRVYFSFAKEESTKAQKILQLWQPDLINAHWSYEHAVIAIRNKNAPVVLTCHDAPFACAWEGRSFFQFLLSFQAGWAIKKADYLVCVSPYLERHIKNVFFPEAPIVTIPNAISFTEPIRSQLEKKSTVFGMIGNSGRIKNPHTLIKSFQIVRKKYPESQLYLIGSDLDENSELAIRTKKKNLSQNIHFEGFKGKSELIHLLQEKITILVHPSRIETHSLSVCEASLCNIPVIAGKKSGALPWTLGEGSCGLLCDISNAKSLANAMIELLENPQLQKDLAARAQKRILEEFTLTKMADAYEELFTKIVFHG